MMKFINAFWINYVLIFCLISPLSAQDYLPTLGKHYLNLPELKVKENLFQFQETIFIENQVAYYALFDEKDHTRLPNIDFNSYRLNGIYYCEYCHKNPYLFSNNKAFYDEPTHRNACSYKIIWFTSHKNEPKNLPYVKLPFFESKIFWQDDLILDSDSAYQALKKQHPQLSPILEKVDFSKFAVIAKIVGGDCYARFKYELIDNQQTKTYTLKVYNIYGGCRAGGTWEHWFKIPKAPAGYSYKFEVILVDK